jgi:hypothetical protein
VQGDRGREFILIVARAGEAVSMLGGSVDISIVIPTRNGGAVFVRASRTAAPGWHPVPRGAAAQTVSRLCRRWMQLRVDPPYCPFCRGKMLAGQRRGNLINRCAAAGWIRRAHQIERRIEGRQVNRYSGNGTHLTAKVFPVVVRGANVPC